MNEPAFVIGRADFDALPEYSSSLPTGTTIGKRWKRREPYGQIPGVDPIWFMGEYYELPEGARTDRRGREVVGVRWRRLHVLETRQ